MRRKIILLFLLLLISIAFVPNTVLAQSELQTVTELNNTEENERVMQDISNNVRLVNTNYENNQAIITVQADRSTTLEIIYPREDNRMGRFDVSIGEGTTEIVLREDYDQVAIWDGGDGLQVDISGTGILNEILAGATGDDLNWAAGGGAAGALIAVVYFFKRKKNKLINGFTETIWGVEREDIAKDDRENPWLAKLYTISNIQWGIIGILTVGIIWYFDIGFNSIPVGVWVFIVSMVGLTVVSYAFVPSISKYLKILQPDEEIIMELDAPMTDEYGNVNKKVPAKSWVCHPKLAERVDIEGEKRTIPYMGKTMHMVNNFEPKKLRAEAADLMSVPDEELISYLKAIEEHKARSNTTKNTAIKLFNNIISITDKVEMKHHLQLDSQERDLGTYGGDFVDDVLKDEIEEYEALLGGKSITEEYEELQKEINDGAVKNTGESQ